MQRADSVGSTDLWDLFEAYFDDIDGPDPCFDSEADQPVECDNSSRPIRAPDNQPVPNVAFQESKAECIEFWDGIAAHLDDGKGEDPSCLPGADVELDLSALHDDDSVSLASVVALCADELGFNAASEQRAHSADCCQQLNQLPANQGCMPAEAPAATASPANLLAAQPLANLAVLTHVHASHVPQLQAGAGLAGASPAPCAAWSPPLQPLMSDASTTSQFSILQATSCSSRPSPRQTLMPAQAWASFLRSSGSNAGASPMLANTACYGLSPGAQSGPLSSVLQLGGVPMGATCTWPLLCGLLGPMSSTNSVLDAWSAQTRAFAAAEVQLELQVAGSARSALNGGSAAQQRKRKASRVPAATHGRIDATDSEPAGTERKRPRLTKARAQTAARATAGAGKAKAAANSSRYYVQAAAGTTAQAAAEPAVKAPAIAAPQAFQPKAQGSASMSASPMSASHLRAPMATFCPVHGSSYPATPKGVTWNGLAHRWEVCYSGGVTGCGTADAEERNTGSIMQEVTGAGFATECEAAHAYDLAALACEGPSAVTNFHKRECACGLAELLHADVEAVFGCISSNQEVMASFTHTFPGVYPSMAVKGRWEARLYLGDEGRYRYLGLFSNGFTAASVVQAAQKALSSQQHTCTCTAQ